MASDFLTNVSYELERAKGQLYSTHGVTERVLADYLEAALHEISMTKYLEALQGYGENQSESYQNEVEESINETEEDDITIINPTQPYTFKDGRYMVIGSPMNNQMEVPDQDHGFPAHQHQ